MGEQPTSTTRTSLQIGQLVCGFELLRMEQVEEISGAAYVFVHRASGARLMWLANKDNNKAFSIAFKTPPANDTGVFHILEHSVLCGSDKFPVKEPFVNLLKTSMQTFLNALTFPDKTMYPVASTNEQDLLNLMDVYLDAVLHPAIYSRKRIFEQEGWHYEVADDGTLSYNGVVFNEMKGALSDPDEVLLEQLNAQLFPDSAYRFESGGNPRAIPNLSYEEFLDTHARHYTLANSYTILYGDLDIERMLAFVGTRFDAATDRGAGAPNELGFQVPVVAEPAVCEMATAPENARVGLGYVIGTSAERERVLAADILMDALMGSNEAPLKRAIMDADLADDCISYLMDGLAQPLVLLELKGAHKGVAERFEQLVHDECEKLAREGIGREHLEASLAQAEFNLREGDWGYYADGVALAMQSLNSWLYDDDDPLSYIRYEHALAHLREHLDDGWFEQLLQDLIGSSTHHARCELVPVEHGAADDESEELAAFAKTLDANEIQALADEAAALHEEQSAPDAAEDLARLPKLALEDIGEMPALPQVEPVAGHVAPTYLNHITTRNIVYLNCYFDLAGLTWDEIPYAVILSSVLGELATSEHTASELDTLVETHLGDYSSYVDVVSNYADPTRAGARFVVGVSAVAENVAWAAKLPAEIWGKTLFSNTDRIRDLLVQRRITMEQAFVGSGHVSAINRTLAHFRPSARLAEQISGVDSYQFVCELLDHFDERKDELVAKLEALSAKIFSAGNLEVSFCGTRDQLDAWWQAAGDLSLAPASPANESLEIAALLTQNEAFTIPSDISFVGYVQDDATDTLPAGSWDVPNRVLTLDYLWNEVRVLGGAYGAGFGHGTDKVSRMYSYRDPRIDETVERFQRAAGWLADFEPSESELVGYIVAAVAAQDAPIKPRAMMRRLDSMRMREVPDDAFAKARNQILHATTESLHACATQLASDTPAARTVFGSKALIEASKLDWKICELL